MQFEEFGNMSGKTLMLLPGTACTWRLNFKNVIGEFAEGALSRLLAGKTVLVIAHRMRTVEAADKIVVLKDGRVAEEGSPKELYENEDGVFRRMADLQSASAAWSV